MLVVGLHLPPYVSLIAYLCSLKILWLLALILALAQCHLSLPGRAATQACHHYHTTPKGDARAHDSKDTRFGSITHLIDSGLACTSLFCPCLLLLRGLGWLYFSPGEHIVRQLETRQEFRTVSIAEVRE